MPVLIYNLLLNRIVQIVIALVVGWGYGWFSTSMSWRQQIAEDKARAAYEAQVERVRQEAVAREIAEEATHRLEAEQAAVTEMQKIIAEMKDEKSPCVLSDVDIGRVRRIDAAGRPRRPARRPR